jgi:hypothetical protein
MPDARVGLFDGLMPREATALLGGQGAAHRPQCQPDPISGALSSVPRGPFLQAPRY